MRRSSRTAIATLLALTLAACGGASDRGLSTTSPPADTRPSPMLNEEPMPELPPLEDPSDPLLIAYCSVQDRVISLEGPLLSRNLPLAAQLQRMRQAQRAARLSIGTFRHFERPELARLAKRWAASFVQVRARLSAGKAPIDALYPAIRALGALERAFSCEVDG